MSDWIEKYKPALSKSDSSWDNPYCVRSVIAFLAVYISKPQSFIGEDIFFCWKYNDNYSDFLLCDVIYFVRMWKSIVESCQEKKNWIDRVLLKYVKVFIALINGVMMESFTIW